MKISQDSTRAAANSVDDLLRRAQAVLRQNPNLQLHLSGSNIGSQRIASDGSTRIFLRVLTEGCRLILAAPTATTPNELAEANSAWKIGKHLAGKNAAVPIIKFS